MDKFFEKFPGLNSVRNLAFIFASIIVLATIHRLWLGEHTFNNFSIFRFSFFNLINGNDLYVLHPNQYNDLYKYSPTFALLMAPFYFLPFYVGIFIWNLLNALFVFWAVNRLSISEKAKSFILIFVAIELLSSIQNAQSNGIMAGLVIGVFTAFERKQIVLAALLICIGFYLKIFAVVAGILFLFYDQKTKFIFCILFWGLLLGLLPMCFVGVDGLVLQYKSWFNMLRNDPSHELNYSFMTLTQKWFRFSAADSWYLIPGAILLMLPLFRIQHWKNSAFRLLYLSLLLIWIVIFNHKAESPTYVIAVCGVAISLLIIPNTGLRKTLAWFVFIFTILSPTDFFPAFLRENIWQPYCLKALPCIIVWALLTYFLLFKKEFEIRHLCIKEEIKPE